MKIDAGLSGTYLHAFHLCFAIISLCQNVRLKPAIAVALGIGKP